MLREKSRAVRDVFLQSICKEGGSDVLCPVGFLPNMRTNPPLVSRFQPVKTKSDFSVLPTRRPVSAALSLLSCPALSTKWLKEGSCKPRKLTVRRCRGWAVSQVWTRRWLFKPQSRLSTSRRKVLRRFIWFLLFMILKGNVETSVPLLLWD